MARRLWLGACFLRLGLLTRWCLCVSVDTTTTHHQNNFKTLYAGVSPQGNVPLKVELMESSEDRAREEEDQLVQTIYEAIIRRVLEEDRKVIREEVRRLMSREDHDFGAAGLKTRLRRGVANGDIGAALDQPELEGLPHPRTKKTNGDPGGPGDKSTYNRHSNEIYTAEGVSRPNLLRLEVRVGRLERQLASQGHTLAGHWERLAAQHGLLLRQAEAGEERMTKLSKVVSQLDTQKARIDRAIIDNHWQEVKLKVIENTTVSLRQGIKQMDSAIQATYGDHGHFYKGLQSLNAQLKEVTLAQKKAESRTNLLENSLRYLIYMQTEPTANMSMVEDNVRWLRNVTFWNLAGDANADKTGTSGKFPLKDPILKLKLHKMNTTITKLTQMSANQQEQIDEMSLDLEQLKDEAFTFYKYLEAMQERMKELQPSAYNMTMRRGLLTISENTLRFLMGKVEELQRDVGDLRREFRQHLGIDIKKQNQPSTMPSEQESDPSQIPPRTELQSKELSTSVSKTKEGISNTTKPYDTINPGFGSTFREPSLSMEYKGQRASDTVTASTENLEQELYRANTQPNTKSTSKPPHSTGDNGKASNQYTEDVKTGSLKETGSLVEPHPQVSSITRTKGGRHKVRHLSNDTAGYYPLDPSTTKAPTTTTTLPPNRGTQRKAQKEGRRERQKVKEYTGWSAEMLDVDPNDEDVCAMWGLEVGSPRIVAHMAKALTGTWMRDSRARDNHIYVLKDNVKVNNLRQYEDEDHLASGNVTSVYGMPFRCTGTGHVMYNGALFCNKFMSNRMMKYDLSTGEVLSKKLKNAGFNNTFPYSCGAYTDLDFAVDEVGLWLIYSSTGSIIIAKINPQTLDVQQEWQTEFPKDQALNSFMICGRLYVVSTDKNLGVTGVTYIYDTRAQNGRAIPYGEIPIVKTSDLMTMMDYNPKDSKLYAWQGNQLDWLGKMVIYDVYFKDAFFA